MKIIDQQHIDAGIADAAIETVDFEIEATRDAFRTLIDGLYTDKVSAVIREISTNGYDSQVEAGRGDTPLLVHLPTPLEPEFSVRDFGTSMTHAKVMHHYTRLFRSDRTGTNEAVGQYGLGSKSPYAISDSFVVTAYLDGEARVYVASLNEAGKPIFSHVSTLPTDEPNGLLVSVTPGYALRQQFEAKARQVYRAFPVPPTTNVDLRLSEPVASGDGWELYSAPNSDRILVRQGTVAYPTGFYSPLNYGYELVVDVPIGTVSVTPSRESLQLTQETTAALRSYVDPVLEDFRQTLIDQVLSSETYFEANATYQRVANMYTNGLRVDGEKLRFGGPNGPVITGSISTEVEVRNSGTKRNAQMHGKILVTITPGRKSSPVYVIDRPDAQVVRKRLRLAAFGRANNGRAIILHDPTPAQIKALMRAHRVYDPAMFTDVTALPDVEVKRKPAGPRPTGPVGLYRPSDHELSRAAVDPQPGSYIAVLIERTSHKSALIDSPFAYHWRQDELTGVFAVLEKHFNKPVLLLSKAAVKRLKPGEAESFIGHVDRYIEDVLPSFLEARRFQRIVDASSFTSPVISELLGETRPKGVGVNGLVQNLPSFSQAVSASDDEIDTEIKDLAEKFPLVFNAYNADAIIEYINLLKEESK